MKFVKEFTTLAAVTALSGCLGTTEDTQATAADEVAARAAVTCSPYSLLNARLESIGVNGMGMDICTDGRVVNWDGMRVGQVTGQSAGQSTINWVPGGGGGGFGGEEVIDATPVPCRMSGKLQNCRWDADRQRYVDL